MSAQIAQRFAAIDRQSNGSHHVSLVYNAASNPNPNPIPSSHSPSSPLSPSPPLSSRRIPGGDAGRQRGDARGARGRRLHERDHGRRRARGRRRAARGQRRGLARCRRAVVGWEGHRRGPLVGPDAVPRQQARARQGPRRRTTHINRVHPRTTPSFPFPSPFPPALV
jgi:hypothetical protein